MTRQQHRNTFNTILKKQEERSIANVYMALRKQYIRVINSVKRYGVQYARNELNLTLFNREMEGAVKKIYLQAGLFMANRTLSELKKSRSNDRKENKGADKPCSPLSYKYATFGFNEEWVAMIIDYFSRHLLEKAVIGVSETTRDRILTVLSKATEEGWSLDQIVKELSDLTQIRGRARMIVRTETVRAANYGVLLGADKYEYETVKEWVAVNDNRTRHSHREVDGEKRENDQSFSNGLLFPGDPSGPPESTINCRCSMALVAKRDSKGRLIPKRQNVAA